ncbi:MAG TPA: tripartite tricarboxylate transporter substrate binding protein [Burkholderiales bacterium]|nr:tripartite tricarboxylate transporter substrate binding protein [Burkholderiales bacterium]
MPLAAWLAVVPGARLGLLLAALFLAAQPAAAQTAIYPAKPIRVVIPFSAGSPIEVPARAVTQRLADRFGQQFVFDYRTGASGTIGTEAVARAARDGYTMLVTNCAHTSNPAYIRKLAYDPIADFSPIMQINVTYGNLLVVHPSLPVRSVKEFIALAKKVPGRLNYATAGIGSPPHVTGALFAAMAGVELVHVPYKGTAVAFTDVLAGNVEVMFVSQTFARPWIEARRVRPLGIGGPRRSPRYPDLPTFEEAGLAGFDVTCYHGMWFPAGVPREIVRTVYSEAAKIVALPEVRKYLEESDLLPTGLSPEDFADFLKKDVARQLAIARRIGVEPQ